MVADGVGGCGGGGVGHFDGEEGGSGWGDAEALEGGGDLVVG